VTNKTIKFIVIAVLTGISLLTVRAQESTVAATNELSTAKVEKKETAKKQASSDDDPWTGFYVGGFGGYTNGRANPTTSTALISQFSYFNADSIAPLNKTGNQRLKTQGFNGGGTVGYNYQKNSFFIGGEVDLGANRLNEKVTSSGTYPCCNYGFTINQTVKGNWLLTVRPRVGVAAKKALVYATGGLAVANVEYSGDFSDKFVVESGSFKKTKIGWTAGAGIEFKVAPKWSVKGEYLFSQFGRTSVTSTNFTDISFTPPKPNPSQVYTHSTDLRTHSLRFGVNYRF
jgi:outer membrane immunogenic protein